MFSNALYIRHVKLSVVIVNYNVKYFLEQALHSVRKASKGMDVEVFVVDNNSVDGSVEMVRRIFPEVHLIANTVNAGFSKANNQAIRKSTGEYVLLLNPDTVVPEDCFSNICSFMDTTPVAGALGVKMIDGKGNYLPESKRGLPTPAVAFYKMFGLASLFPTSTRFGKYHLGYLNASEIHEVEVLAGAFMLIRSRVLNQIGLLDEDYFMYGEDIDLSYRVTQAGYKNYYFPLTTIIHYKGESTKKATVNYVFVFYKAMIIFAQKHYSAKHAQLFSLLIHAAIYARAGIALISRLFASTYLWVLDMLLLAGVVHLISQGYAQYKFDTTTAYAPITVQVNSIVYALLWSVGLAIVGGYRRRINANVVWKGILLGSLAIAVFYAFANESFRFSRAIIVLGSLAAVLVAYTIRAIRYAFTHQRWSFTLDENTKTIIVGNQPEVKRVQYLLTHSKAKSDYIGYVSVGANQQHDAQFLGTENQLADIIELFKIEEVIFCSKDLSTMQIMKWMHAIAKPDVHFKIVPEESIFIIGSNSKDEPGDFYTLEINLDLHKPMQLRKKRFFDITLALAFFVTIPMMLLVVKRKAQFILNLFQVFLGAKTWVGYAQASNIEILPALKPAVLTTIDTPTSQTPTETAIQKVNFLYAKDYSISNDLAIVFKQLSKLGD